MSGVKKITNQQKLYSMKLYMLYCSIFYFVPFLLFQVFGNPLEAVMLPRPNYYLGLLFVIGSVVLFWFFFNFRLTERSDPEWAFGKIVYSPHIGAVLSFLFLGVSLWSRQFLELNFRHSGITLSDIGPIGFVLESMKLYAGVAILVHYRMLKEQRDVGWRIVSLYIICGGFIFSIQGAFDIIFVAASFVAATHHWRKKLNVSGHRMRKFSLLMLPVGGYAVLFIGTANKVGIDAALLILNDGSQIFANALYRISFHFYSTSHHVTDNFFNFSQSIEAIGELWSVIRYRLGVIFGLDFQKPYLGTISRMNFLELSIEARDRIGASPSILGSTFYLPGAGLAIFWYVFVIRYVISLTWDIVDTRVNSWLTMVLSVVLVSSILDAALDSINPFGIGFLRLLFLVMGANFIRSSFSNRANYGRSHHYSGSKGLALHPMSPKEQP